MNPKLKNLFIWLISLIVIVIIGIGFTFINSNNYKKLKEIKLKQINHPENLPTSQFAKATAFGFDNTKADIYWLETIQYIGSNAVSSAYKKYLYKILDLITDLNPYFAHPYKIGMLLIPEYNPRYEDLSETEKFNYIKQAEKLGLKGIKNFCDKDKIDLILKQDDLKKIWTEDKYKNPCKSYEIPYYLAFIYYFYLHDNLKASDYYKIASTNEDSVDGAKILSAIMKGKGGDREKAFLMFLNIGKNLDNSEDKACSKFADILQDKIGYKVFQEKNLDSQLIKFATDSKNKVFPKESKKDESQQEDNVNLDNQCENYINKAIRELNLYYIEQANKKYKKDHNGENAKNAKILFDEGYIKYLPIDYQQEDDYGIIYSYNEDLGNFDYEMGNY